MAKYRSLLLGCGARATEHVAVYADLPDLELVACCDLQPERVQHYQQTYGIPQGFTDYEEALRQVQPDIVHLVTCPGNRVWEAEVTAAAGVKAAIFEKPLAICPSDQAALRRAQASGLEIITNCQRRYFPQFRDGVLRQIVAEELGEVYLVRASCKSNCMAMGPHTMDLLLLLLGEEHPNEVWAMCHTINETEFQITHRAPESTFAQYWFPSGLRVFFDATPDALGTPGETSYWMHLHFDVLGSAGRLYLTQNAGYWYTRHGHAEPLYGPSSWDQQGYAGQRDFTAAVATHLDGGAPHLNRYELHQHAVDALLAAQASAYHGHKIACPASDFTDAQWLELRERLRRG
ncbi:MAG: Gfo/Idh/MocA family oxidoreductase [Fimbriimonadaceae bacterium]|nr:Gfo/Idh/MocA family oxidoreductase [Fimbriimonadaceae bacterium]